MARVGIWQTAALVGLVRAASLASLVGAVACGSSPAEAQKAMVPQDHAAQVQTWRDKHEADYRRDFVTIAGLQFLEPGTHTIGSGPGSDIVLDAALPASIGRLTVQGERVHFDAAPGVVVTRKEQPVAMPVVLNEPWTPAGRADCHQRC